MLERLGFSLLFVMLLGMAAFGVHQLPQITIYTSQSLATPRVTVFAVVLGLMILSWPKRYSSRVATLLFAGLLVELVIYFRPVPIDASGIGEAAAGFLPFWLKICLLNIVIIPAAVILLIYGFVYREKPNFVIFAAAYLVLLAFLFPFEQICRWGAYALM
jgi:hypothetical protein